MCLETLYLCKICSQSVSIKGDLCLTALRSGIDEFEWKTAKKCPNYEFKAELAMEPCGMCAAREERTGKAEWIVREFLWRKFVQSIQSMKGIRKKSSKRRKVGVEGEL